MDWIFFGPARLIAIWPYAGVAIAAALIASQAILTWRAGKPFGFGFFREAAVFTGLLWLIFNAFELQMSAIATQSGKGAFFRMDLVVLVPILYVLSIAAAISLARQLRSPAKRDSSAKTEHADSEQ